MTRRSPAGAWSELSTSVARDQPTPALDLVGAWHLLDPGPRRVFRDDLECDDLEGARGKAWARSNRRWGQSGISSRAIRP